MVTNTLLFQIIALIIMIFATGYAWYRAKRTETVQHGKAFILLFIYYQSYLLWLSLVWLIFQIIQGTFQPIQHSLFIVLNLAALYARFIEPYRVVSKKHHFQIDPRLPLKQPIKIALIADLHIGLYSGNPKQLQKIVEHINQAQVELVIMAGDWTYEPEADLAEKLTIFKHIQCPIYAVNGNHDEQTPGPPIQALLANALAQNNIIHIENQMLEYRDLRILGIGDLWAGKAELQQLKQYPQDRPWLIIAHNPDCVADVPALPYRAFMLSGHTHGGQIEIPMITSFVMKQVSKLGYKKGLYSHQNADVFVTAGIGMVGIPFRFCVPPTVEVITLH